MDAVLEFFQTMISPGMLPFSLLMGLNLLYWAIVAIGMVELDFLDGAVDGLLDGTVDGAVDGALESVELGGDHGTSGVMISHLNIGQVPATIIISFIIAKMWLMGMIYYTFVPELMSSVMPDPLAWALVFIGAFVPSVYATGMTTRPLRKVFKLTTVTASRELIGKICKITSSKVTDTFGTAELSTEGAPFILNVTCEVENELSRDGDAVIVDYDREKGLYTVRPVSD